MADLEGRTLDRYQLEELMGRGGMADVYIAYDPHFERRVAVKVFKREDEDLLRRFVREAHMMASLSNPHLMPVYDAGASRLDSANIYYIVMPLMEGGTLRSRIRKHPLPLKQCCTYIREIASALDYVHSQGIIHRDIKSSNVLLDKEGRSYLSDFGIARTATTESTQLTTTGNVLGTVDYIAPELFETNSRANELSDLYSLGVLLYEMVTGHLPFTAENAIAVITMQINNPPPSPRTYVPELSPLVERVILRALEKQPALRYPSASELAEAFCRAASTRLTRKIASVDPLADSVVLRRTAVLPSPATPAPEERSRQLPPARSTGYQEAVPARQTSQPAEYAPVPLQSAQYPAYPPTRRNQTHGPSGFIAALVIIALLAVIGATVFVVVETHPGLGVTPTPTAVATPNVAATSAAASATALQQSENASATAVVNAQHATATVEAKATMTAQAHQQATATAQAKATQVVLAHATATAAVIVTATSGTPAYSDPLTDANSQNVQAAQWDTGDGCAFHSDGYYVSTSALSTLKGCHESAKQFQNFAAQVDMTIQKGHSGGLFFRMSTVPLGGFKGYLFELDDQGNYKISASNDFSLGNNTILRDWTPSSAIKTGSAKNQLQVIARDNTLLFYVNGVFLPGGPITDATYSSGSLGFLASSNNGDTANVVYSNLSVYAQ
jgi:Serine/threonine protein kinase